MQCEGVTREEKGKALSSENWFKRKLEGERGPVKKSEQS